MRARDADDQEDERDEHDQRRQVAQAPRLAIDDVGQQVGIAELGLRRDAPPVAVDVRAATRTGIAASAMSTRGQVKLIRGSDAGR